jgi:hypothetical protein
VLEALRRGAPVKFTLHAVTVDSRLPGFRADVVAAHLAACGFAHAVETTTAYAIIEEKKTPRDGYCSFCARLRRGFLSTAAAREGCGVIALGHHLDDFAETLLLNLMYGGTLSAMSANYLTRDGRFRVVRPLVYAEEADIAEFAAGRIPDRLLRLPGLRHVRREAPADEAARQGTLGRVPEPALEPRGRARERAPRPARPAPPRLRRTAAGRRDRRLNLSGTTARHHS